MPQLITLHSVGRKRAVTLLILLLFSLAVLYCGSKIFLSRSNAIDFKYVWLAGTLWHDGISPYGSAFLQRARETFAGSGIPQQWAYPPHFRVISSLVSLLAFDDAVIAWRSTLMLSIALGVYLLTQSVKHKRVNDWTAILLLSAVALTFSSTATAISIGQSSPLIFLGYCLFVYGYLRNSSASICLSLVIIMLKPTYGLIPVSFLTAQPRYWKPVIVAGVLTILMSVWGLWGQNIEQTAIAVGEAFSKYKDDPVNLAPEMTGLRHLVYVLGFGETSQIVYVIVGSVLAFCIGIVGHARKLGDLDRVRAIVLVSLLMLVFVPMHTYDGYFVFAVAVPALVLSRWEAVACLISLAVIWRSNNLATLTGLRLQIIENSTGATIESFATFGSLLLFTILVHGQWLKKTARY